MLTFILLGCHRERDVIIASTLRVKRDRVLVPIESAPCRCECDGFCRDEAICAAPLLGATPLLGANNQMK